MKNYFISWFYSEQANDESYYPSVGKNSSSMGFQYVYWRCIYVIYQSALITNKEVVDEWLFFTNVKNLPVVDNIDFREFFEKNHIRTIQMELTRRTPKDWYGAWRNQLYVFDMLDYLKGMEGNHLILDSDCIITHSLKSLYREIAEKEILTLPIDYTEEREINGCSIEDMRSIYQVFFGGEYPSRLRYMGGEFIAVTAEAIRELLAVFEDIWGKNYALYEAGKKKLNEEAHILSLCYYRLGKDNEAGRKYVKRMWTDISCDLVEPSDAQLPIWHLPAEKKFGFQQMFHKLSRKQKVTAEELYRMSNRVIKIKAPKRVRKINWYYRHGIRKIQRIFGREDG